LRTVSELMRLAAKAGRLADQVLREPEPYRMAGRLNRLIQFQLSELNEREISAFAEAHVDQAKGAQDAAANDPVAFYRLQCAIAVVSYHMWEDLWNEKHPDKFGEAWNGQDFALMSIWREKVRTMIQECRQGAVLAMTAEEYVAMVIESGASEEAAEQLAEWLSEVEYEGTTPST
jgi:hypothetical protein